VYQLKRKFRHVASEGREGWKAFGRISSLKRKIRSAVQAAQAAKARHETLISELGRAVFENGFIGEFPQVQHVLNQTEQRSADLGKLASASAAEITQLQAVISGLRNARAPRLSELQRQCSRCATRNEEAAAHLHEAERRQRAIDRQRARLSSNAVGGSQADSSPAQQQSRQLTESAAALQIEVQNLRATLQEAYAGKLNAEQAMQREQSQLAAEIAPHTQAVESKSADLARIQNEIATLAHTRTRQIRELGHAAAQRAWESGPLASIAAELKSIEAEERNNQQSVETNTRETQLLWKVVGRSLKTVSVAAIAAAVAILVSIGLPALLIAHIHGQKNTTVGGINYDRIPENVGFVIVYGTYAYGNGSTIDEPVGWGSCFAVSKDGCLITNKHVAEARSEVPENVPFNGGQLERVGAPKLAVCFGSNAKDHFPAEILYESSKYDIAVLKVNRSFPQPYRLGSTVKPGDAVIACGFPAGATDTATELDQGSMRQIKAKLTAGENVGYDSWFSQAVYQVSVTRGIVSAIKSMEEQQWIQTDAAIQHGNSGGPLLSQDGAVAAINTLAAPEAGTNFSLEAGQLREELAQWLKTRGN
jgi:S1-C subfamily serine protease